MIVDQDTKPFDLYNAYISYDKVYYLVRGTYCARRKTATSTFVDLLIKLTYKICFLYL